VMRGQSGVAVSGGIQLTSSEYLRTDWESSAKPKERHRKKAINALMAVS
jgi:hypothetical protein